MDLRSFEFDSNSSNLLIAVMILARGIACFVGLMFVVVAGGLLAHTLRWELSSQVVVGRVVATEKFTPRNMYSSRVHLGGTRMRNSHARNMSSNHRQTQQLRATVRYELDDVEHTATTRHSLGSAVHVGDQIRLIYLPGYPAKAKQIRPVTANYIASSIGLVVGCLILLFAKRFLKKLGNSRARSSS